MTGEAGEAHQEEDFEDVARVVGHGDDVAAEGVRADEVAQAGDGAHQRELFAGLGAEVVLEDERCAGGGKQPVQDVETRGFVEAVVVRQVGRMREDVGDDVGVIDGFLADVERGHVEAAAAHEADEVLDVAIGLFGIVLFERVADEDEVVEEVFRAAVGMFGGGFVRAHALDVAVGMLDFGAHQHEQAAVGFVAVVFGVVFEDGNAEAGVVFVARVYGGVYGGDAGTVQEAVAQVFELFAVVTQDVVGMHQHGLFGSLMGNEGVAVAVATNP